jgi:alpha-ketoglutarate-dependent 2,4-dichlorophenoxyacetate dioxygenase
VKQGSDFAEAVQTATIRLEPVTPSFVAAVRGVDLSKPLAPDVVEEIVRALDAYAVLVFHDQPLSSQQLVDFGEQLGPLDRGLQQKLMNKMQSRLGDDAVSDISNVDTSGAVADRNHMMATMTVGNRFWHTDSAYAHHPFRYSILAAVTAASWGGETEFADLRAAYDDLDSRTKALIADKVAVFFSHFTRQRLGIMDPPEAWAAYPPSRWPMVRTHPGSGRKVIWCDSKVCEIEGMSVPEGRALAHDLVEHIGQREHVYAHSWRPNDLVIYDNRAVLHRGRTFDLSERREMRRVATVDDSSSLGPAKPRAGFASGPPLSSTE